MTNFQKMFQQSLREGVKFDLPFNVSYADDLTTEQVKFIQEYIKLLGPKTIKKLRKLHSDFKKHNKSLNTPYKSHTGKEVTLWLATNRSGEFMDSISQVVSALSWIDNERGNILK